MYDEYFSHMQILLLQASQESGEPVCDILAKFLDEILMSKSDHKCHVYWPDLRQAMDKLHGVVE